MKLNFKDVTVENTKSIIASILSALKVGFGGIKSGGATVENPCTGKVVEMIYQETHRNWLGIVFLFKEKITKYNAEGEVISESISVRNSI